MTIKVWSGFSKRRNSTKQPNAASATDVTVYLKEDTSVENPSFILTSASKPNIDYVQAFGDYYFVTNIVTVSANQWEIVCEMDPLASNKSAIVGSTQFIAYASSNYDVNIIDTRVSAKTTKTVSKFTESMPHLSQTGCYILAVAGLLSEGEYGMCTYYVCTAATIKSIAEALFLIGGAPLDNLVKQLKSLYDGIISCTWVPFDYSELVVGAGAIGVVSDIYIGDTILEDGGGNPIRAVRVTQSSIKANSKYIALTWPHSDFRDSAPYTTASLFIPMYGNVDLNINDLIGNSTIGITSSIDCITGDITIAVTGGTSGALIKTINYNVGVACPIAQTSNNMTSVLSSVGGTAAGAISAIGGMIAGSGAAVAGGALAAVVSGSNAVLNYQGRSISVKGSLSGRSFVVFDTDYIITFYIQDTQDPTDANYIALNGRPVMKAASLSTYSGYVQCVNASINIPGMVGERDAINSFLNNGFFIE